MGAGQARRLARHRRPPGSRAPRREHDGKTVIKEEKMPDGRSKLILKDEWTGEFVDVVS